MFLCELFNCVRTYQGLGVLQQAHAGEEVHAIGIAVPSERFLQVKSWRCRSGWLTGLRVWPVVFQSTGAERVQPVFSTACHRPHPRLALADHSGLCSRSRPPRGVQRGQCGYGRVVLGCCACLPGVAGRV